MRKRLIILVAVTLFLCSCRAGGVTEKSGQISVVPASSVSAAESGPSSSDESLSVESAPAVQTNTIQQFVDSKLLNKRMAINVYLPKGYTDKEKHPVLYLLHGEGATSDDEMFSLLGIDDAAERLIDAGKIKPLIIASVQIDRSYGVDSAEKPGVVKIGGEDMNIGPYESYVTKEAVPFIDANYSTVLSKEGRYIAGISMAGFAALHIGFRNTELFGKVGGHSPSVEAKLIPYSLLFPTVEDIEAGDPNKLAQTKDLSGLKIWLDCGDKDPYCQSGTKTLQKLLTDKGWAVEYCVGSGEHNNDYWQSNLDKYLAFYNS
ncbi:alpha/beta hydrolase [Acetanaerobacterium elongatum]|uniref:Enterochelin esterase n=1 Tax=Acetanaerobacterium elongatum TaxID=258515 RepID=A0A1G9XHT9_9FIRM|nr:alpha/beta hydrolase-fold protein [Acetanaerobacterium elongatum]SDM95805.1 Enterochelin esterase [Acetanaerobacterium elongatum]